MRGGGQKERERDSNLTGMPGIAGMQLSISTRIYARVFNDSSLHPQPLSTHIHTHTHTHSLSPHIHTHKQTHTNTHTNHPQTHQHTGLCQGGGSCVQSVWLSPEKQFAFLEFRSHQEGQRLHCDTCVYRACVFPTWTCVARACVRACTDRACVFRLTHSISLYLSPSLKHAISLSHSLSLSLSLSLSHTHTPARSALLHTIYPSHTI